LSQDCIGWNSSIRFDNLVRRGQLSQRALTLLFALLLLVIALDVGHSAIFWHGK